MLSTYLKTLRSFDPNVLRHFVAISVIGFTVDGGIFSVVFNIFLLRLDYAPDIIGQVNSAGLITFALCSLPAGALGNRLGNRSAMICGLVVMMISSLLMSLAEFVPDVWRLTWLFATYPLSFAGIAIYFVNTAPFLMAATTDEQRNHAFAIQSAMIALSAFAGSLLGGILPGIFARTLGLSLESALPYRYPLLLASLSVNIGIVVLIGAQDKRAALPLPARPQRTYASLLRVPRFRGVNWQSVSQGFIWLLLVIAAIRVLQIAGMAVAMTFFNVYMDDGLGASTTEIGLLAAVARLISVPIVLAIPLMSARWGNQRLVIWSTLSAFLFMLPLALIPDPLAAGIGYMGAIAGSSIRYTAFMVFSMSLVTVEQRSLLSGVSEMTAGMSFALMAYLGGIIIVNQGYGSLFLTGAILSLIGTLLFWAYFGTTPRVKVQSSQNA